MAKKRKGKKKEEEKVSQYEPKTFAGMALKHLGPVGFRKVVKVRACDGHEREVSVTRVKPKPQDSE